MSSLSIEDVHYILRRELKNEKYQILLDDNKNISKEENISGFLSSVNKLSIKYKRENKIEEEFHVFIKRMPESEYHRELIISKGNFDREANIYNQLLNEFVKLTSDAAFPKCYLARKDLIVLEDLSVSGFKTLNINETFDLKHCEKAIEAITRLHAASIQFEITSKCKIIDIIPSLPAIINLEVVVDLKFYHTAVKALRKIVSIYLNNFPQEIIVKALEYYEELPHKLGPSERHLNVLIHGDVWGNNILFSYNNNMVNKACLVDFQFSTYTTPAYDLLMLLHNCTTSEFRKHHSKYLYKYYYSQLFNLLQKANIDLESIMSWNDFEETINEMMPNMLAIANISLSYALMPQNIIQETFSSDEKFKTYFEEDRDSFVLQAVETSEVYRQRIIDALTSFLNYFK